jgi:transposase
VAEKAMADVTRLTVEFDAQAERLAKLEYQLGLQTRHRFGRRSEKLRDLVKEATDEKTVDAEAVQQKRREREKRKHTLEKKTTLYKVPDAQRICPKCDSHNFKPVGEGKVSEVLEYVPAKVILHRHVREVLACECHGYMVTADTPNKVQEKGRYGPSFVAHVVTRKCADSVPLYRLSKEFQRLGMDMPRSTLTSLFHAAAESLSPLSNALLETIRTRPIVNADETIVKVLEEEVCRTAYMWTFRADSLIAYKFSPSRSGQTPADILEGTAGALVVDGYSGYNKVHAVSSRIRVGCWAHTRRKFYDALEKHEEAREVLLLILELYRIEAEARAKNIVRTAAHLALRKEKAPPALASIKTWLENNQAKALPKSPMGQAMTYALNQWPNLIHFVDNADIPLDNNAAECALRVIAVGRKNFLFVGHDDAGANLAGLYSLVATCEANNVNPEAYLADVLIRVATHPASKIYELLPHNWKPPDNSTLPPDVSLPL